MMQYYKYSSLLWVREVLVNSLGHFVQDTIRSNKTTYHTYTTGSLQVGMHGGGRGRGERGEGRDGRRRGRGGERGGVCNVIVHVCTFSASIPLAILV